MQRNTQLWSLRCTTAFIVLQAVCLLGGSTSLHGQTQKAQNSAVQSLIQKAQALESRGRPDIAVQVWQQILLSDPNNAMALEGVARDYRLSGNSSASDEALDKLRRITRATQTSARFRG